MSASTNETDMSTPTIVQIVSTKHQTDYSKSTINPVSITSELQTSTNIPSRTSTVTQTKNYSTQNSTDYSKSTSVKPKKLTPICLFILCWALTNFLNRVSVMPRSLIHTLIHTTHWSYTSRFKQRGSLLRQTLFRRPKACQLMATELTGNYIQRHVTGFLRPPHKYSKSRKAYSNIAVSETADF
ncbi:hypothetical protein GQR58_029473 [Nymphon striatum]|nr:hypothetical protein GQR58_029473 [Nymphon striatum]